MKTADVYWSLYNEIVGRQIDGLTYTQVREIVEMIADSNSGLWLAWHEGLDDWKPLAELPELFDRERWPDRQRPPFAPPPPAKDGSQASASAQGADTRLSRRFRKNFVVTVTYGNGIFLTRTINISLGGVLLKDPPPEGLGFRFQVTLSRADGAILCLQCSHVVVPGGGKSCRLKFINSEDDSELRSWLLDSRTE